MANIRKSFNFREGVKVDDSVLVVAGTRVGIGTTVPIKDFDVSIDEKKPTLSLELKYHSGNPVISAFERVSKPGRRIFSSADSLPKINNGLGIAIVSTPKGVMTDIDARKQNVGGEIICKVF